MPLAEYLQIHPAGAECPAGANYFLNLEGIDIESSPSVGNKPEPKNMTLFGFHKEDDMDEHWCVSTSPPKFKLAPRAPARKRVPHLEPDTLIPSIPHPPPRSRVPAPPRNPRVHVVDNCASLVNQGS